MRESRFWNVGSVALSLVMTTSHVALAQDAGSAAPKVVSTDRAPKASGPYSQGIVAGGFLFAAGQLARDPESNKLVEGDIAVQTDRVLTNLEAILKAGGCGLGDVVKVTVFLTDLNDFAKMNDVYSRHFGDTRPARTTVQVAKLNAGAAIEVDLIALIPQAGPAKKGR
jgi:2-iminobutanoate/2-iminopropanoate deaminase